MTPRLAAAKVLLAIERGRTTLAAELDAACQRVPAERDRALLVELTAGTMRWRAAIDALIGQCSNRPLAKLSPGVRAILRLSAYQLEHLDRVPVHAVLNEAVSLTRTLRESSASGFVNGVLRTFTRTRARLTLPSRPRAGAPRADQIAYLSTTLSHPAWLVERWLDRHGFDAAERWCRFNNSPPAVAGRVTGATGTTQTLIAALREAGVEAQPARTVADAITWPPGALGRVPAELMRGVHVQDEASQAVAHAAGVQAGERVLDVCAAPGGKTLIFASALGASDAQAGGRGLLVAADVRGARVRLLHQTLCAAGVRVPLLTLDATRPLPFGPVFDRVFVDAPCSGLGVLRRDPDLKWTRQPDDLSALASIEQQILANAANVVAAGGRLIYATCSSEPEENDAVVQRFLNADPRFVREPVQPGPHLLDPSLIGEDGCFRTLPFAHGLDAFFAAVVHFSR